MANIQDVARLAKVSVATVSRVLNNNTYVSPETKTNVLNAIERLNYQPNLLGRNLRRSETKTVLVLLPTISNTFYSKIVKGIEDIGRDNGYTVMICTTASEEHIEKQYLNLLKNKLVDGIIFMTSELSDKEFYQIAKHFPVVQCCEYREGIPASYISIDNEAAAYKAVSHLLEQGHTRIGMISSENTYISTAKRELGYKRALTDHNIKFDSSLIKYGNYGFKSGNRAAKQFTEMDKIPTAIFSISDMMAIGAIRRFIESNMKVPDDVAVVGFDNIGFSYMSDPKLTTISQPQYDMGTTAMNLLLKRLKDKQFKPQNIIMEHKLIIRESTLK